MAPLSPDNTARYVVHYTCGLVEHTQTWRSGTPASPSAMMAFLDALWTAASPLLFQCNILSVGFIPEGSNISNDVEMPDFVGQIYGSGTPVNSQIPFYLDFVGRSPGGRRTRAAFFNPVNGDQSFRVHTSESEPVDDVYGVLIGNSVNIVTIEGLEPVWKPYANWGVNAYWQRARRS